jgi:N-dimethylarginine dimethylaminohydrolase
LRAALLVAPAPAIATARPLQGEPSANYERAKLQLEILTKTLKFYGCEVTVLAPHGDEAFASAAGDVAVTFEDGVALMRPAALSRRPEIERMEHEFGRLDIPMAGHLVAPGVLGGNDVLLAGNTAFVAVSKRSNALGRAGFAQIARAHGFAPVEVRVSESVPALRAVASAVASDAVVLAAQHVDRAPFAKAGFKTIVLEHGEDLGAGVLAIGEHHVLADVRYSRSVNLLRRSGIHVEAIDLYDFGKIGITPAMLAIPLKRI